MSSSWSRRRAVLSVIPQHAAIDRIELVLDCLSYVLQFTERMRVIGK
jgi:hypothetical protein